MAMNCFESESEWKLVAAEMELLVEITTGFSSAKVFSCLRQEILGKRDQKKLPNHIGQALSTTPSGMPA
jgi:hypothetical protein